MENDDFLKAFMDVDILQTEGIAEIIGRVIGKLWIGMQAAGLGDRECQIFIRIALQVLHRELFADAARRAAEGGDK